MESPLRSKLIEDALPSRFFSSAKSLRSRNHLRIKSYAYHDIKEERK